MTTAAEADRPSTSTPEGPQPDLGWTPRRWSLLLDRIEHRQPGLGLRFSAPPLWLEVTMTGPDADGWPSVAAGATPWNWQSGAPCAEAMTLAEGGASEDQILEAAARYTIENLVLNAVHEIGEWFRIDGRRAFPAHDVGDRTADALHQGNGTVVVHTDTEAAPPRPMPTSDAVSDFDQTRPEAPLRVWDAVAASRFTYLPATSIEFHAAGPSIRRWPADGSPTESRSIWSPATVDAARGGGDVLAPVSRDVHRLLVLDEVGRICEAFHVDGEQRWRLASDVPTRGATPIGTAGARTRWLRVTVEHGDRFAMTP